MTRDDTIDIHRQRLTARGDSLVILAFRCWHAGFDYGDADCWQYAWAVLSNELGPRQARPILNNIEDLVRAMRAITLRRIEYFPPPCCRVSTDERAFLELIAALQAGETDVRRPISALFGDIGQTSLPQVLGPARALAGELLSTGIVVLADRQTPTDRPHLARLH